MSTGADRARHARASQQVAKFVLGVATTVSLGVALFLIGYIFYRGWSYISWEFLTQPPRKAMTEGGIYPAIVGTVWLVIWTAIFALPFGIMAGIYLSEFALEDDG